jgi:hypothetical protein
MVPFSLPGVGLGRLARRGERSAARGHRGGEDGSFTGTALVDPAPGDRIFAVGPGAVVSVPGRRRR